MTTEDVRAIAYGVYEAINAKDNARLETLFDPNIVRHAMGEVGIEKAKEAMAKAFAAAPDTRFVIEDLLVEGNKAALRVTVHRASQDPAQPLPTILELFRIENGRVVEIWGAGTSPRRET